MAQIQIPKKWLASNICALMKRDMKLSDEGIKSYAFTDTSQYHFHGGMSPAIAWNDVQEANLINEYFSSEDATAKILIPSYPTEGYNQHSHTSEYDGGVLPGVMGAHTHKDNRNGGFAFAVFYPATGVPLSDWEE